MNDPHGLLHYNGKYHLFFQHVPDSLEWRAGCQWGHAISADLLHWEVLPVALAPDNDEVGIWTGTAALDDEGEPFILYTSVARPSIDLGRVRIARPVDAELVTWVKGELVATAPQADTVMFRDPIVFREDGEWHMLVGHGTADGTGAAALFTSSDGQSWEYDGLIASRSTQARPWTGDAWECPQLVRRAPGLDSDVLIVGVWEPGKIHHVAAAAGTYDGGVFTAGDWQRLTAESVGHYAPSHFVDMDGRPCLLFWIRGVGHPGAWTGAISVPYVVSDDEGRIVLTPHPAVAAARTTPDGDEPAMALDIEWSPQGSGRLGLIGPDGVPRADLALADGVLTVAVPGADPVTVEHRGRMIRIIADAQVLEVVASGGLVGLPLADVGGGFVPRADDPSRLVWWHLS